jgi:fumarate hydratase class II
MGNGIRRESDSFGSVDIPADHYWGAQTQRALAVFSGAAEMLPPDLVHAIGLQKCAAVRANRKLNAIEPDLAIVIEKAAREVWQGSFDKDFPLPVWQTGSGTQTNMNANEVIANRANELLGCPLGQRKPVHPIDHVNRSQSSNDSFPTVMHVAAALVIGKRLRPALKELKAAFSERATAFARTIKIGRTHLMDAVPMTVGQSFDAFARQICHTEARLKGTLPRLHSIVQGGTAVGTGLNAPPGFDVIFCEELSELAGIVFTPNSCKFEGMGAHDALVEVSGALNVLAVSLIKIANDLRFLGSGPRCGFGELLFPDDGLSSSIMPGKRNPTIAEAVMQAAFQVIGNHATITMAGASGNFELNVAKPVIIYNLLQSIELMAHATTMFASKFISGLEVDEDRLSRNVDMAILPATALNPILGYDQVARITRKAMADRTTPREAAIALGLLTAEEYDRHVRPLSMANSTVWARLDE